MEHGPFIDDLPMENDGCSNFSGFFQITYVGLIEGKFRDDL